MSALARFFRHKSHKGLYVPGDSLRSEADAFIGAWQACSKLGKFELTGSCQANLLFKHMIQAECHSPTLSGQGLGLNHKELVELELPDKAKVLQKISVYNRKKGALPNFFHCHPLYLAHFASLAKQVLKSHPGALAYTENVDNRSRIQEILQQHREEQKYNVSWIGLYNLLLGEQGVPDASSEESLQVEELKPVVRKRIPSQPDEKKAAKAEPQKAKQTVRSRSPKKIAPPARQRNSSTRVCPGLQPDAEQGRSRPRWAKGTVTPAAADADSAPLENKVPEGTDQDL